MLYLTLKDTIVRLQNIALKENTSKEDCKTAWEISFILGEYYDKQLKKLKPKK
jgi:hypothetical protein